jgi:flagellin-specific chaperone FliS
MGKDTNTSIKNESRGYMLKKLLILMIVSIIGLGCEAENLNLTIKFDHIDGLKANDGVIFEENQIGRVDNVTYTKEGNYLVDVMIYKTYMNAATEHARFFIVSDPKNSEQRVVEMIQILKGGKPLQNNSVLEGSSRSSAIIERLGKDLTKGMESFRKEFNEFSEELKKIPDSEAYKKLEDELNNLYDQMKQSGKEVNETIQKEILPRLEEELENLKKRFHEKGQGDELKPLEIKMEEIKNI